MSGKPIELISGRCCCGLGPKFQLGTSLYNVFTLIPDEQCLIGHYFNTQPHLSYWHMRANAREYFLKFEETLCVYRFLDNKVHESFQFYLVTWLSFCTLKRRLARQLYFTLLKLITLVTDFIHWFG